MFNSWFDFILMKIYKMRISCIADKTCFRLQFLEMTMIFYKIMFLSWSKNHFKCYQYQTKQFCMIQNLKKQINVVNNWYQYDVIWCYEMKFAQKNEEIALILYRFCSIFRVNFDFENFDLLHNEISINILKLHKKIWINC